MEGTNSAEREGPCSRQKHRGQSRAVAMPLKRHHVWSSDKIFLSGSLGTKGKGQGKLHWFWVLWLFGLKRSKKKKKKEARQHSWETNWKSKWRAEAGEEMALQPQQFNSVFICYRFMTTAQDKLFKDFWELDSRFLWENTNRLEIFLSKAGNVPLT